MAEMLEDFGELPLYLLDNYWIGLRVSGGKQPDRANPGFGPHDQLCCAPGGSPVSKGPNQ
jgi:hypothetical protein